MLDRVSLTADEFRRLCEFLYRRTGMIFTEAKRYYVERRAHERMLATDAGSFENYFVLLRADAEGEIEQFVNAFTVNETYFSREDYQLACLASDLLAARLKSKGGRGQIRIWSAPCSTGEEPYSIAMWLLENWPPVDEHEVELVGSDIDTTALARAKEGVYGKRAVMRLSPALVSKYFEDAGAGSWKIIDAMRESVRFTAANIVDRAQTRTHGRFDVIFCRNVLIYFDDTSRRVAAENLYESLLPGGFICLGHSESMSRISPLFEVARFGDAIVYQRPEH